MKAPPKVRSLASHHNPTKKTIFALPRHDGGMKLHVAGLAEPSQSMRLSRHSSKLRPPWEMEIERGEGGWLEAVFASKAWGRLQLARYEPGAKRMDAIWICFMGLPRRGMSTFVDVSFCPTHRLIRLLVPKSITQTFPRRVTPCTNHGPGPRFMTGSLWTHSRMGCSTVSQA